MKNNELVLMGIITSPHGIRGDVKVKSYTNPADNLCNYQLVTKDGIGIALKQKSIKGDMLVCQASSSSNRNHAEELRGIELFIRKLDLPSLADEEFYIKDLIGKPIIQKADNQEVGVVIAVHNFGAGDILEIKFNNGNVEMLPFAKEIFPSMTEEYLEYITPKFINAEQD